jgi:type IV pilus assembly protein PilB
LSESNASAAAKTRESSRPSSRAALQNRSNLRLGRVVVDSGLVSEEDLERALQMQAETGERLGNLLVVLELIGEEDLVTLLAEHFGVQVADLASVDVAHKILGLVPQEMARRYLAVPVAADSQNLSLAMVDPTDVVAMDDIEFATGLRVKPLVASERAITEAIGRLYGNQQDAKMRQMMSDLENEIRGPADLEIVEGDEDIDLEELSQASGEAPVIKLVNLLLTDALRRGASDIHIEPYEKVLRVRFRIDGVLYEIMEPPKKMQQAISSRIKIMSELDISERRRPQDGRIKIRVRLEDRMRELDLRVSTLPTIWGEKIVMRLLDPEGLKLNLADLGFEKPSLEKFTDAIKMPWGIVLVTGPTGSGKTNTLYSALSTINDPDTNIMTAEDPVEFNLMGINQVQINDAVGLNFASALRAFLRQDPNVVLVGEIRDAETANIAIKAALTGHLVLSTLHTNDAPSTINRMIDMGVERFLVSSSVQLIVAQRLVRRLCKKCREVQPVEPDALIEIGFAPEEASAVTVYHPKGCHFCNDTGYKGRTALFEVMQVTDKLREMIVNGANNQELRSAARADGMITLRESGLVKIWQGVTSVEEVLRETTV